MELEDYFRSMSLTDLQIDIQPGSNMVMIIQLPCNRKVIFKPLQGEKFQYKEIEPGTYYKRERAAYLVSKYIHSNLVSVTIIKDVEGKLGAFQEFILRTETYDELNDDAKKLFSSDLATLAVFDMLIWQMDRTNDNFLFTDANVFAIDNGLSFAPGLQCPFLGRNKTDSLIGEKVQKTFMSGLTLLTTDNDKMEELKAELMELLSEDEVNACIERLKHMTSVLNSNNGKIKKSWLKHFYYNPAEKVPDEQVSFYKV